MGKLPPQTVEKSRKLPVGTYTGRVLGWEARTQEVPGKSEPALYADFSIGIKERPQDEAVVLVVGYPVGRLTDDSFLGKLLKRFGVVLDLGKEIDTDAELNKLIGRDVSVRIYMDRKTANGQTQEFSRIDRDSLRPAK